jgi:hypothetical protein
MQTVGEVRNYTGGEALNDVADAIIQNTTSVDGFGAWTPIFVPP